MRGVQLFNTFRNFGMGGLDSTGLELTQANGSITDFGWFVG